MADPQDSYFPSQKVGMQITLQALNPWICRNRPALYSPTEGDHPLKWAETEEQAFWKLKQVYT